MTVSTFNLFTESFAAGNVTINNSNNTAARRIYAGGIAGYGAAAITKCAALNGSVAIEDSGTTTSTNVYRRRIAWVNVANATTNINANTNNITTVTCPDDYSPSNGKTLQDGLLLESPLTSENFFGDAATAGQLGWSTSAWEWGDISGYPVLK
jgi:hypothetical protein